MTLPKKKTSITIKFSCEVTDKDFEGLGLLLVLTMNDIQNTANASVATRLRETYKEGTGSAPKSADSGPQSAPLQSVSEQDWERLYKELEIYALERNFQLKFSVDEATGRTVIKIINSETQKVMREIPPEEILRMAATLEQLAKQIIDTEV